VYVGEHKTMESAVPRRTERPGAAVLALPRPLLLIPVLSVGIWR
jgi:hypothetical protein